MITNAITFTKALITTANPPRSPNSYRRSRVNDAINRRLVYAFFSMTIKVNAMLMLFLLYMFISQRC